MRQSGVLTTVRLVLACLSLLLCGCGPRLTYSGYRQMTPDEMLARSSLVFVGVIESHHSNWHPFRQVLLPVDAPARGNSWRIVRRRVQIELVLRGSEPRKAIDVYEVFANGGLSGDSNSTEEGQRALFLVEVEDGQYHVVLDARRSIFPVTSGPHRRLPLDDSHPLWERIALMNYWVESGSSSARIGYPNFSYSDPGNALGRWRKVKLERGLIRHPSADVRVPACRELLMLGGWGQDECWDMLSESEKAQLPEGGYLHCTAQDVAEARARIAKPGAAAFWERFADLDSRRMMTAVSSKQIRAEFCKLYAREYPGDHDNGCPADQPPPATIVTERGDVPLLGPWPSSSNSK